MRPKGTNWPACVGHRLAVRGRTSVRRHRALAWFACGRAVRSVGLRVFMLGWGWSAVSAAAQVNTETLRLGTPQAGLHGDAKADVAFSRGNVELAQVGASARAFYQAGIHTPLVFARGQYGEQGNERFAESTFVHARWTAMWWPRLGSEVFGQLQYDAFVRLKFRALIGAGARVPLVLEDWVEVYMGTGYMLEREVLGIPSTYVHPRITLNHRWTSYASVKLALGEVLQMSNVVYVQPRFDAFDDTRVLEELDLKAAASKHLSLVNTFVLRFDSIPPDTVKKLDLNLTAGLQLSF